MTFDLGVWRCASGLSATSASFIYSVLCEGKRDLRLLPAEAQLAAFYHDLIATWPDRPAGSPKLRMPQVEDRDTPWAAPLHRAADYMLLSSEFRHAEVVLAYVVALAGQHGLTVFDPQSDEVYPPQRD